MIDNYMVRGLICKEHGKIDEAIADFEKLITLTSVVSHIWVYNPGVWF